MEIVVQNANFVTLFSNIYIFYPLIFFFSSTTPFTTKATETSRNNTAMIVSSAVLTLVTIIMVVLAGIMFYKRTYIVWSNYARMELFLNT